MFETNKLNEFIIKNEKENIVNSLLDISFISKVDIYQVPKKYKNILVVLNKFLKVSNQENANLFVHIFHDLNDDIDFYIYRKLIMLIIRHEIFIDLLPALTFFKHKSEKYKLFLFNAICYLMFKHNKNSNVYDLLIILNDIHTKSTDFYIFQYYKGILLIRHEQFLEGFKCISKAFKCQKLQPFIFYNFKLLHLFKLDINHDDKDIVSRIISYGLLDYIQNIQLKPSTLYNIFIIYFPLVCTRNFIYIYFNKKQTTKLYLVDLINFINMNELDFYMYILKCIAKGLIKGYLSISKKTLVLSKVNPFPELL